MKQSSRQSGRSNRIIVWDNYGNSSSDTLRIINQTATADLQSQIDALEQENIEQQNGINDLQQDNQEQVRRISALEQTTVQLGNQIVELFDLFGLINNQLATQQESIDYLVDQVDYLFWLFHNKFMGDLEEKHENICDWMEKNDKTDATIFGSHCQINNGICTCEELE